MVWCCRRNLTSNRWCIWLACIEVKLMGHCHELFRLRMKILTQRNSWLSLCTSLFTPLNYMQSMPKRWTIMTWSLFCWKGLLWITFLECHSKYSGKNESTNAISCHNIITKTIDMIFLWQGRVLRVQDTQQQKFLNILLGSSVQRGWLHSYRIYWDWRQS